MLLYVAFTILVLVGESLSLDECADLTDTNDVMHDVGQ